MSGSPIHVFLSYRREASLSFARMMQLALEKRGCSVFFDYDSLQDGMIGDEIWSAIDACDVFLAVYGKGSLDRCDQSEDWVRLEIERAFAQGKKIIPVAPSEVLDDWAFPSNLPGSLSRLVTLKISRIDTRDFFNASIEQMMATRFPVRKTVSSPAPPARAHKGEPGVFRLMRPEEITPRHIQEVLDMEAEVYPEHERQELSACLEYFKANPNVYLFFQDEETGQIAGNIDICPITDECYGMIRSGRFLDREISPDMILSYDMPALYNLYFEGITIRNEYRNTNLFLFMFNSLVELFRTLGEKEVYARRMIADAVTKEGEKFCKIFGMTKIAESDHLSTLYEVSLIPPKFRVTSKPTKALHDYYAEKYEEIREFLDMTS